ncbi:MAG: hypothetical protein IJY46_04850 [Lentisphaeria bacterium]|nr:hypothetical protein [Lentisphaeria bacterium]
MHYKNISILLLFIGLCANAAIPNSPRGRLNNFVVEQVRLQPQAVPSSPAGWTKYQSVDFEKRNDGWIYLALKRGVNGNVSRGDVRFFIDNDYPANEMMLAEYKNLREGMKYLKKGKHTLNIWVYGTPEIKEISLREIPAIIFYQASSRIPGFNRRSNHFHSVDQLFRNNILQPFNVIVDEPEPPSAYADFRIKWRSTGRQWFGRKGLGDFLSGYGNKNLYHYWTTFLKKNQDYDGFTYDELHPDKPKEMAYLRETLKKMINDGVLDRQQVYLFYPAFAECVNHQKLFEFVNSTESLRTIPEVYLAARVKAGKEDDYFRSSLKSRKLLEVAKYLAPHKQIWSFGIGNGTSSFNMISSSGICLKAFFDLQLKFMANEPYFKDYFGVAPFLINHLDEEHLRWIAALFRHYLIEGNRGRMSDMPLETSLIKNAGFNAGEKHWTFQRAAENSIVLLDSQKLPYDKKLFYATSFPETNEYFDGKKWVYFTGKFAVTTRNREKPNLIKQKITGLVPGQVYSVKVNNADYKNITSADLMYTGIRVKGAQVLESGNIQHRNTFRTKNKKHVSVLLNYMFLKFRATGTTAELILSDWDSDEFPGKAGQQIMWDMVIVEPFFTGDQPAE